ncbi:hypothetical protein [Sphingobium yanoikuyae]|uniref:Uncharacterized protein n=1 Tax=Sphingobium yanoikuyae TaxID=13690 RepID=A0A9X7UFG2_SPHYA|nr:hypothetical protein [Sphingobium yanoikuyae]QNG47434.1 hypothetical protein H3V42_07440 [Sphingobium yanoikuyae]
MVTIPLATIQPGITAPAGNPALDVDAVDMAIYNMQATLLSYVRGKRLSAANVAFKDRVGVSVSAGAGAAFTAADPAMNDKNSLNLAASTSPQIPDIAESASFTFVTPILPVGYTATGTSSNLFGSSGGVVAYVDGDTSFARLVVSANWNTADGNWANPGLALNTKAIFWISYDAPSKTWRYGINSATAAGTLAGVATRKALLSTDRFRPFAFTSGANMAKVKHSGWAIFNTAYGAGGTSDAKFAALIAAWKTHMGI